MRIQHKPGCKANMSCLVYHPDGVCPGPYGVCTCGADGPPMTASNPCCEQCFLPERDGPTFYSHAAGYALPEGCKDEECDCHKEPPATVEKDCACAVPLISTKDTPLQVAGIKCLRCHLAINWDARIADSKHQPEKEWWEEFDKLFPSFSELEISAIGATAPFFTIEEKAEVHTKQFAMREHNNKLRYIKSFIAKEIAAAEKRIAAQSEKKGREIEEKYQELILAVGNKHPNETRHETALRYIRQAEEGSSVAARSSEEGKTV